MAGKASSPGFHETAIGKEIAAIRARAKAEAKTKSKRAEGPKVERRPWTKTEQRTLTKAWLETTLSATEIGKQLGRAVAGEAKGFSRNAVRRGFHRNRVLQLVHRQGPPSRGSQGTPPWVGQSLLPPPCRGGMLGSRNHVGEWSRDTEGSKALHQGSKPCPTRQQRDGDTAIGARRGC